MNISENAVLKSENNFQKTPSLRKKLDYIKNPQNPAPGAIKSTSGAESTSS